MRHLLGRDGGGCFGAPDAAPRRLLLEDVLFNLFLLPTRSMPTAVPGRLLFLNGFNLFPPTGAVVGLNRLVLFLPLLLPRFFIVLEANVAAAAAVASPLREAPNAASATAAAPFLFDATCKDNACSNS